MDIIWDGNNFFLRDDSSVESIFKSNNFGWSTTAIDELNDKIIWIFTPNVLMGISWNYDVILDILEGEMVVLRLFLVWSRLKR